MDMRKSLWQEEVSLPSYPPLAGNVETDVAVIGGGIAGILTAHELTRRGVRCIVIEADRILHGETAHTTAKITSQHGLIYDKIIRTRGMEIAKLYAAANEKAIEDYESLVRDKGIDCDFRRLPAYLYAVQDTTPIRKEVRAAAACGIKAAFTTKTTLPFAVAGAVRFENQAQFHPLKFLSALLPPLTIYENTTFLSVSGHKVTTDRGTVTAKAVVFATNFPPVNFPGLFFLRMHRERSYVLALEHAARLDGMYLGTETGADYSMRNVGDGDTVLLGGAGHRTGENRSGGNYGKLHDGAHRFFPTASERFAWSAEDCITLDGVPYIGRFSASRSNHYVATGFGKWGMTSAMVAAHLLADLITGRKNPYTEVFTPQRFSVSSIPSLWNETVHACGSIGKRIFYLPAKNAWSIPAGHGGTVRIGGQKVGVYREIMPDGSVKNHRISVKCPHLGCELEWNPEEKTWDCPCHGSRFDPDGVCLTGPAQTNAAKIDLRRR